MSPNGWLVSGVPVPLLYLPCLDVRVCGNSVQEPSNDVTSKARYATPSSPVTISSPNIHSSPKQQNHAHLDLNFNYGLQYESEVPSKLRSIPSTPALPVLLHFEGWAVYLFRTDQNPPTCLPTRLPTHLLHYLSIYLPQRTPFRNDPIDLWPSRPVDKELNGHKRPDA